MSTGIVVIGASWGGLAALSAVVRALPADFDIPVVIVQHRSKDSDTILARLLQDLTTLRVCEAEDKAPLLPGSVHIAPPDYHLLVESSYLSLAVDAPVRFSRPSIDVTFLSAADSFLASTIGVVLTGANEDGSQGLKRIAARGGLTIVQDPETAESPTMPRSALQAVPTSKVLPLAEIGDCLAELAETRRTPQKRAG